MTSWLLGTGIMLIHVLGMISAVMALMSSRTSQGAVAWIISLLTFPYAAVPAYWLFGRPRFLWLCDRKRRSRFGTAPGARTL